MNGSHTFPVASWTYQHTSVGGGYGGQCYAISSFTWGPQPQGNVDSGRAPGTFPGGPIDCANAAVDPNDRDHFLYSKGGEYKARPSPAETRGSALLMPRATPGSLCRRGKGSLRAACPPRLGDGNGARNAPP